MEIDEGADQKSDILNCWMAAHVHLKNEFTEDEKCQNLMSWLIWDNFLLSFFFLFLHRNMLQVLIRIAPAKGFQRVPRRYDFVEM